MYEEFYGLTEKPFSIQPDPSFLYWGRGHRLAYAMLEYGVVNHAGLSVVTGEVGCGKTTLIHRLLDQLSDTHTVALLSNIQPGRGDLLSWVLMGFGESYTGKSHVEMFSQLQNFFIDEYAKGRRVVLIIDEAQNLTVDMLEEIRMLSNINAGKDQLLQLILVGQPQLKELLGRPDMLQLAQRIGSDFHLTPLSREEVHAYIDTRLSIAGAERRIFTEKAIDLLAEQSRGVPRVINIIADTALVYAFSAEDQVVDVDTVKSVIHDKMEYGVFGLASSPNLTLSERGPEKKNSGAFLRDVTHASGDDGAAPAPRRIEAAEAPRIVRSGGAGLAAASAPHTDEDDEENPRDPSPRRGPAMTAATMNVDYAQRAPAAAAPVADRPRPVESAPAPRPAAFEEIGVVVIGGDPTAVCVPDGVNIVYVAAPGEAAEIGAGGVELVALQDDSASGGRARNAGYRRLKKIAPHLKFVQFVDAGATLDPDWLAEAMRFMARRPEVVALEGRTDDEPPTRSIFQRVINFSTDAPPGEIQTSGPTVLFRADAFEAAGGFRGDIFVNETADLCLRLRRRGSHIWRVDAPMAIRKVEPMGFFAWRRRARENGFEYAAGAALHGAPPERFHVTEQARAVMWGLMFPLFMIVASLTAGASAYVFNTGGDPLLVGAGVFFLGVFVYVAKVFLIAARLGPFKAFSWMYGLLTTLGHFPEYAGVSRYWFGGGKAKAKTKASA